MPTEETDFSVGLFFKEDFLMSEPLALTLQQASQVLNLSPRTVWGLAAKGLIPHVRIGVAGRGRLLFPKRELEEWLSRQAQRNLAEAEAAPSESAASIQ